VTEQQIEDRIVGVAQRQEVLDGVSMMLTRGREFPSPATAVVAGIGVQEQGRELMDDVADQMWTPPWTPGGVAYPEVVIGSGPHALIYAAVRSAKGVPVLVLEKNLRAGGSFACSGGPAFWLNSRNRPGPIALPGEQKGLNVLPGCELQPSMIGGGEYQTNNELAWTIRMNLMMLPNVEVHTGVEVLAIEGRGIGSSQSFNLRVRIEQGNGIRDITTVIARRVVLATGLGDPVAFNNEDDKPKRLLSFAEFMSRMDNPFPLQGMDRVAVIGGGDSGKTAVESLIGQGPSTGMSVAMLDFPRQIDWYGAPFTNQADWCENVQGRYARIGKSLGSRVIGLGTAGVVATSGYESVQIGLRAYDYVINCAGYTGVTPLTNGLTFADYAIAGRVLGKRLQIRGDSDEVYVVGPAAGIALTTSDRRAAPALDRVPGNAVALWRYAPLTAALADGLPRVSE
jgi:hypothetical protein